MANANFKDYIKVKVAWAEKDYELIQKFEYLKKLKVNNE
jgi:hypothetical protein